MSRIRLATGGFVADRASPQPPRFWRHTSRPGVEQKRRQRRREKPGVAGGERLGIDPIPRIYEKKSIYPCIDKINDECKWGGRQLALNVESHNDAAPFLQVFENAKSMPAQTPVITFLAALFIPRIGQSWTFCSYVHSPSHGRGIISAGLD